MVDNDLPFLLLGQPILFFLFFYNFKGLSSKSQDGVFCDRGGISRYEMQNVISLDANSEVVPHYIRMRFNDCSTLLECVLVTHV